jgi:hypothetical protein
MAGIHYAEVKSVMPACYGRHPAWRSEVRHAGVLVAGIQDAGVTSVMPAPALAG